FQLFAPAVTADDLVWRRVYGNITIGKFNIAEPTSGEIISANDLDCVLVPALAVDHAGNRLGFGAGYFDRSLQNSPAIKIVLVFDQDIVESVSSEDHDIKVDYISTESRFIKIEN
ncbi:MAG: 5-formyltetrahydrofolate cyclo-ligase, partial [Candidatus Nanopelagicales bacterium]